MEQELSDHISLLNVILLLVVLVLVGAKRVKKA